jgi:hypothetical protein
MGTRCLGAQKSEGKISLIYFVKNQVADDLTEGLEYWTKIEVLLAVISLKWGDLAPLQSISSKFPSLGTIRRKGKIQSFLHS